MTWLNYGTNKIQMVTTCHKAGFDQYGKEFIDGLKHWKNTDCHFYAEGFDVEGAIPKRVEHLQNLERFKAKHKGFTPNSWQWDVIRFSNKVYAMHDTAYECNDLIVWCDADCAAYADIPDGYIESLLPQDCFLAYFRRKGLHTETGFWLMDGNHPEKQAFLDTWLSWYETDKFKDLRQWHDCETFDATVRLFLRRDRFKVHSLSGDFEKHVHPMSQVELARYMSHKKGQLRKRIGYSPESLYDTMRIKGISENEARSLVSGSR